jgi:hypothetical protein
MSGQTNGILLAVTSGLLSLVGLISIFISMNSQHNVQRAREILWSIFTLPYKKALLLEKGAIGEEVFRNYILYEQIIHEKNPFLKNIISFSQIALTFSGLVWTVLVCSLLKIISSPIERTTLILCLFLADLLVLYFIFKILGVLRSICKVGRLPTVDELLDADTLNHGSNIITLAAVSSCLKVINSEIYIGFPIPYKNLMVKLSMQNPFGSSDIPTDKDYNSELPERIKDFKKLDPSEFKLLDDDRCYYPIYEQQAAEDGESWNSFFATIEFIGKQGYVSAEFYYNKGIAGSGNTDFVIYPYSFVERFINRMSELDPFSRYIKHSDIRSLNSDSQWINTCKSFVTIFDKK